MAALHCIVVTPETTVLDEQCAFVALPLFDGEIGIAPGHSPMIGRLGAGELRLTKDGQTVRYYVEGGFVQVVANTVSVLTDRAVLAEKLDAAVAEAQLLAARTKAAATAEALALREQAVGRARAQLRVARKG